jgi:formylglycine-generating enzyme required for sulfatase activity/tetratricopeptide (TPR) repeat protein
MRAILAGLGLSLLCSWMAGCGSATSPESDAYVRAREKDFATWQKHALAGTTTGARIWECALCPKMSAHKAGAYWAGSPQSDPDRQLNELLPTDVPVPEDFAVGTFEVTRGEFDAFVRATHRKVSTGCRTDRKVPGDWAEDSEASFHNPGFPQGEDHPAVCVSWQDAREYAAWLNTQTSGGYHLPKEAEWQFAAFGGGYSPYIWGETPLGACNHANALDSTAVASHPRPGAVDCKDGAVVTAPVGSYLPNPGMSYDVIGNAAEWTATCEPNSDAESTCTRAIVKGGSWKSTGVELRLAARNGFPVETLDNSIGFRVAKSLGAPDATLPTAAAYLARGRLMMNLLDRAHAQADFERAVELEPRNPHALAARGWINYRNSKVPAARDDFNSALKLDASNAEAIAGLGTLALVDRNPQDAVKQLDRAIEIEPDYHAAVTIRAVAHQALEQWDQALRDAAKGLKLAPTDIDMLRLRVSVRMQQHDWPQALAEVDELSRVFPTLSIAQYSAAFAYSHLLRDDDAVFAATRAILAWHSADNLVLRALVRPWMDTNGRRKDLEAALQVDPKSRLALSEFGKLESRLGNHQAALQAFTNVLQQNSDSHRDDWYGYVLRGIESLKVGQQRAALKDFESAMGGKPSPFIYNNLCWELTIANVALTRALDYCNRAVAGSPDQAAYLDSRAMALLRLGRWEDSIKTFDAAIRLSPTLANSLYGRGLASQLRCQCEDGVEDMKSALRFDPTIQRQYERFGVATPFPPAAGPVGRSTPLVQ